MCAWSFLFWGFAFINREEFYFLVNLAGQLPSWWKRWLYKEKWNLAIKKNENLLTVHEFILVFIYFVVKKKNRWKKKKIKIFVSKWRKMALKLQEFIFLVCNSFPSNMSVTRDYLISYNFRVAERGLTFSEYKQKEIVECFPLVLRSKRPVVVLQDTAKKYKVRATSETR